MSSPPTSDRRGSVPAAIDERLIRAVVYSKTRGWRWTPTFEREDVIQTFALHVHVQLEAEPGEDTNLTLRKAWLDTIDEIRTSQGWRRTVRAKEVPLPADAPRAKTTPRRAAPRVPLTAPDDTEEQALAHLAAVDLLAHLFRDITPRQRMICELRLQGMSMRAIADRLELTESRISQILSHLAGRARAKDRGSV
jgi:RNA polymerase sigma factor (sigma-70 family)